ncbi:MAG: hypothetical protein JWQ30_331 [Sediminibacterium sp.]|nr:hypothetical protein [Sediminibacterium sp.]
MEKEQELLKLEDLTAEQMASFINDLIDKDFSRLVQILYRLDVSEDKLKSVLLEHPTGDAGNLIAALIIERIAQREKAKELFKQEGEIPEEDKW